VNMKSASSATSRRQTAASISVGSENDGPNWEFFDAYGFRIDALEDGEQFHVSMLHVPFCPRQLTGANSQRDV
jgi:hypothetical protein